MSESINALVITDNTAEFQSEIQAFNEHGYTLTLVNTVEEAISRKRKVDYDVLVISMTFPANKCITFCRSMRDTVDMPIIILTDNKDVSETIIALEVGADCYLPRPLNSRLLLAQMNTLIRRKREFEQKIQDSANVELDPEFIEQLNNDGVIEQVIKVSYTIYKFREWSLNTNTHMVYKDDENQILLTNNEYNLLFLMLNKPKIICSRRFIMDKLNLDLDTFDRAIDIIICRLRSKLELDAKRPQIIKTIRSSGYMLDAHVTKVELNATDEVAVGQ